MPTAYRRADSPHWWIAISLPGRKRHAEPCPKSIQTREQALAYAKSVEFRILAEGEPPPRIRAPRDYAVTILDAALDHPATRREIKDYPAHAESHRRRLIEFVQCAGVAELRAVRMQHVESYIQDLRDEGLAWDTRRHALLWIRRACASAPRYGLPDPIAGVKLDKRTRPESPRTLDLPALAALIQSSLADGADPRIPAALALMGYCGLRPSELIRLDVEHIDTAAALLHIGVRVAKNDASRRTLPVGRATIDAVAPLIAMRRAGPLFVYGRTSGTRRMDAFKLHHILVPVAGVPPKNLRKSFATICTWELALDSRIVDAYMGHSVSGLSAVTGRHYLGAAVVRTLRAVPDAIDAAIATPPATEVVNP